MSEYARLPRANEAIIPREKLTDYALDPEHPRGQHKARVFSSALGINQADWRYLLDAIMGALPDAAVRSTRISPFGVAYEVIVTVDGLNGASLPVVTTWIVEGGAPARLTSTWVDIP